MQTEPISGIIAAESIDHITRLARTIRRSGALVGLSLLGVGLVACVEQQPTTTAPQQAAAPAPLPPILPFDQAVTNAANTVFTNAPQ
jgi:hypothetical protein